MEAKRERFKRIRGAVLKLLAHEHPGAVDAKVLHCLLDDLRYTITEEEFSSHLKYLGDKGFVVRETRKNAAVEIEFYLITPEGLDVLDGFKADIGVDVRF